MKERKQVENWRISTLAIKGSDAEEEVFKLIEECFGSKRSVAKLGYFKGRLRELKDGESLETDMENMLITLGIWLEKNKLIEHSNKPFKQEDNKTPISNMFG